MAKTYNFDIDQGSDKSLVLNLKDAAGAELDLAGYAARMQLRRTIASPAVADELTSDNGRISIEAGVGQIICEFPHDISSAYAAGAFVYDIELVDPDGIVRRILEGKITVRPEVTR